jgi:quercetin dioxygenase-like cupin family protein
VSRNRSDLQRPATLDAVPEPRSVDLPGQAPVSSDEGVEDREVVVDEVRWARVEYAAGHGRSHWCDTPHCGYVVSGAIRYEFEDGRQPLDVGAGSGFLLPASPGHRGRNAGSEPVVLFIIDALPG